MADLYAWATAGTTVDWNNVGIWSTSNVTGPGVTPAFAVPTLGDNAHVGNWSQDFVIQLTSDVQVDALINSDWRSSAAGGINCRIEADGTARTLELLSTGTCIDDSAASSANNTNWIDDSTNLSLIMHGNTNRSATTYYAQVADLTLRGTVSGTVANIRIPGDLTVDVGATVTAVNWISSLAAPRTWTINGAVSLSGYTQVLLNLNGTVTFAGTGTWDGGMRNRAPIDFGTTVTFNNSTSFYQFETNSYAVPVNLVAGQSNLNIYLRMASGGTTVFPSNLTLRNFQLLSGSVMDLATNNAVVTVDSTVTTGGGNTQLAAGTTVSVGAASKIILSGTHTIQSVHSNLDWETAGNATDQITMSGASKSYGDFTMTGGGTLRFLNATDNTVENLTITGAGSEMVKFNNFVQSVTINGNLTLDNVQVGQVAGGTQSNELDINMGAGTQTITNSVGHRIDATGGTTLDFSDPSNTNEDGNSDATGLASGPAPLNNNVQFFASASKPLPRRFW